LRGLDEHAAITLAADEQLEITTTSGSYRVQQQPAEEPRQQEEQQQQVVSALCDALAARIS
jgi:hypothetical protein